jgi:hypothetical protein
MENLAFDYFSFNFQNSQTRLKGKDIPVTGRGGP